jgi:hypothetical protein
VQVIQPNIILGGGVRQDAVGWVAPPRVLALAFLVKGWSVYRATPAELSSATVDCASGFASGVHGMGRGFSMLIQVRIIRLVMPLMNRNESTVFSI